MSLHVVNAAMSHSIGSERVSIGIKSDIGIVQPDGCIKNGKASAPNLVRHVSRISAIFKEERYTTSREVKNAFSLAVALLIMFCFLDITCTGSLNPNTFFSLGSVRATIPKL